MRFTTSNYRVTSDWMVCATRIHWSRPFSSQSNCRWRRLMHGITVSATATSALLGWSPRYFWLTTMLTCNFLKSMPSVRWGRSPSVRWMNSNWRTGSASGWFSPDLKFSLRCVFDQRMIHILHFRLTPNQIFSVTHTIS